MTVRTVVSVLRRTSPRFVRNVAILIAVIATGMASAVPSALADEPPAPAPAAPEAAPPTNLAAAPTPAMPDTPAVAASAPPPVPAAPAAPPPPPYSLPWQLRPVTVGNVVRLDTATAFYEDAMGNTGSTVASTLLASYKVTPEIAPMVRVGFSRNDAPAAGADGSSFVNPIIGATYARKIDSFRLAGFLGTTIPVGMGAGDMPDAGASLANAAGIKARSAMDNAMFAVNYMTGIAGLGFAYVDHKFTAQIEATLLQLFRVRGDNAASATDSTRTNATAGIHLGYFLIPQLSVGGDLRYQRWLSHPTSRNAMGMSVPIPDANMDTVTFAVGPRAHFKFGKASWIRPGISYARGLDAPLTTTAFNVVQIDVPVVF
jgi:hypothetical protein